MFANCTHIIVSILKAWKVTVVGIQCDGAAFFNAISRRSTPEFFLQNSASKVANRIIVHIVKYLY